MDLAVGTVIDDRYEVLGRIGSGAVAVVHLVRHVQLGSLHALKVLLVPTRFVQSRLMQEGRFQGALRDRNVVVVTDVVDVDGAPGLVMEYVRGPSLERLMQHVHFSVPEARALGAGILLGVRAVHAEGVVHRDLKPANVLIDVDDTSLVPKIADFGLAKIVSGDPDGPTATRAGSALGTPAYMPPEQIRDARSVDERADVFALGAVLYELLTSRRAFPGDDLLDLYGRIREGRFVPVRALAPEVPPELEAVVAAALVVDRDARIGSVSELLDRWTGGQGEAAAEFDWPPRLVDLAQSLAPGGSSATPSAGGLSGATFDLRAQPEPRSEPDTLAETVEALPQATVVGTATVTQPMSPPIGRTQVLRRRLAFGAAAFGATGASVLVCVGAIGAFAAAIYAGWVQWGPQVPSAPVEAVMRPMYTSGAPPKLLPEALEPRHLEAWNLVRDGRPAEAVPLLATLAEGQGGRDEGGVLLLLATAELQAGDAAGYARIEHVAQQAGTRRGPLASLARLAADAVAGRLDAADLERHRSAWPQDLLFRLLLASVDGVEGDVRGQLARELVELDPGKGAGYALLAELSLQRGDLANADAVLTEGLAKLPEHPRLRIDRARWLLASAEPGPARQIVETLGTPIQLPPAGVDVLAGALRTLGDRAALDAVGQALAEDDARYVAFCRGRGEAAFGLGDVPEAFAAFAEGFDRATATGRFDDAVEIARLVQGVAVLVGRTEDLELAVRTAEEATALVGLPGALHDRITPRILLLNGLAALDNGDAAKVERLVQRLESIEGGERQAALLRAAAMARQGVAPPVVDAPTSACLVRSLDARWRSEAAGAVDPALYAPLAADGPCVPYGIDRYVRADAELHLAIAAADAGDVALSRAHLEALDRWAPDRLLGTPLYDLAAEVHEGFVDLGD